MAKPRQSLTQGLSASIAQKFIENPESAQSPQTLSLEQIKLPAKQPRRYFDPEKQAQLVQSIREYGILEPLLVRPLESGGYELVAGERRYRAAQEIGLQDVPIVVREFDDQQALQVSLIENLQREDLNPVEETEAILELLAIRIKGSPSDVASVLHRANHAKNRGQELEGNVSLQLKKIESTLTEIGRFNAESFRSSRLPLLSLPPEVLKALREGKLEFTKARAIARVKDEQQRTELLKLAASTNLTLSEIKQKVQEFSVAQEETSEVSYTQRYAQIGQRLKKSAIWEDSKKRTKLEKLLSQLDELIGIDNAAD
ncbi:MAG: ParB/RepB/Spo0J family partition protein [Phormidesmis sp. CAN_BIN44]|nr:ParB/RepB/Spo0J family partition protein [Phormidesmis sp. CAN_BIN44]